jgi:inosine-uridine nucleoside N-ribohydrolase
MTAAARPHRARPAPVPCPVVIDTDPGIDDALALMLALRSPELRVELLTTVAGNVPVSRATANVRRILSLLAPPVWPAVAQGLGRPLRRPLHTATAFHNDDGLGGVTHLRHPDGSPRYPIPEQPAVHRHAVQRLLQVVQHYGRDLTVIALGPLTNVAHAIRCAPATMQQLGRLVIMGGAIGVPGNISPVAEFNIFVDPHAADVVFRAGLPITLVPLDVTTRVRLTRDFLRHACENCATRLMSAIHDLTQQPLHSQDEGMAMHDPLAVAVAIDPSLVTCAALPVCTETRGLHTIGMTVADRRPSAYWRSDMPRLAVALEVDTPRVLKLFATRVLT